MEESVKTREKKQKRAMNNEIQMNAFKREEKRYKAFQNQETDFSEVLDFDKENPQIKEIEMTKQCASNKQTKLFCVEGIDGRIFFFFRFI